MTTDNPHTAGQRPHRRVTLVDVARHAGISVASASKAVRGAYGVSEPMQQRVLASVNELGYRPDRLARGMRGSTSTIGLVVPDLENSFINLIVQGMKPVLAEAQYDFFLAPCSALAKEQDAMVDALLDHQMDGLVLVAPRQAQRRLEQIGASVPLVVVGRHGPAKHYDTIASDDHEGSRLIVEHFVRLGHRRIAFLAESPPVDYASLPEHVRLRGYREAMMQFGIGDHIDVIRSSWTFGGGSRAAEQVLGLAERPTALHAGADIAALGFLSSLWDAGLEVPSEISVAGYDNSPTGALNRIGLTSVDQAGIDMGAIAAETLIARIRGTRGPVHQVLPPKLVIRSTTAPPNR